MTAAMRSPAKLSLDARLLLPAVAALATALVVERAWLTAILGAALALAALSAVPAGGRRPVIVGILGLATGAGAVMLFSTGLFQGPLIAEFGWTRTQYYYAVQITAPIAIVSSPLAGMLIDRYGVRRVVLPSTALLGVTLVALGLLTRDLASFYLLYALVPLLGAGTSAVAFARLVANWFEARRGLALGVTLAGMGIGGAVLTPGLQAVIAAYGWRTGYWGTGAVMLLLVLPLMVLLIRDTPSELGRGLDGSAMPHARLSATAVPLRGLSAREARRTGTFWLLFGTFLALGFALGGLMYQLFPVLTASGMDAGTAAAIAGSMGLALIAGRAVAGFLMDRYFAPRVAMAFLIGPVAGAALLASDVPPSGALAAALLVGLAAGAEVDVIAYLAGKYFGTRSYASNFGWLYAAWAAGAAVGPLLAAQTFDRSGSYSAALWVYAALALLGLVLLSRLRRYPTLAVVTA
jgi:MFS family permease